MDKRTLENYAQAIREIDDLAVRMRSIDEEVRRRGREDSENLLRLRDRYGELKSRLENLTQETVGYVQGISDPVTRKIMWLRYIETRNGKQLTWRDIAQRMGTTEDSCRKCHDRWLTGEEQVKQGGVTPA